MAGQSASFDDQDDSNASFTKNHEHGDKKLCEEIAGTIKSLKPLPKFLDSPCCIYKVSDHIRQSNKEAYTPQIISIGPFHRDNPKLQQIESFKLRCLEHFNRDYQVKIKLIDLVSTIRGKEENVRECYSETIPLESDDFVKMILVDAIFIIEFFWRNYLGFWGWDVDRRMLPSLLSKRMQMDLILLENQLPYFIIEKIYNTAFPSRSESMSFLDLCYRQFREYYNDQNPHFQSEKILHFTDLVRNFCMPPSERPPKRTLQTIEMYSADQLDGVGLKFKKSESSDINCSPLELKYAEGVLEIPPFQLDSTTEIYARNLVAFEECHYRGDPYVTDYYTLLSMLIKTGKDLDVLVREQIIFNWKDDVVAPSMLNRIVETIDYSLTNVFYGDICEGSNKFYKAHRTYLQIMMAKLKRDYFSTPWTGAATIGGILLLLLTVIQTVCALISVKIAL